MRIMMNFMARQQTFWWIHYPTKSQAQSLYKVGDLESHSLYYNDDLFKYILSNKYSLLNTTM